MDHVECAGAFFRLLVDRGDDRTSGFESEAEEDGLRGRIKIRKNPGVSTSGFFVS